MNALVIDYVLFGGAVVLLLGVLASRASDRLGVPALLLFLAVGMLAGSEGIGGIPFEGYRLSQSVGIVALGFVLFFGGLGTNWSRVRPVLAPALSLATVGVLCAALLTGLFARSAWGCRTTA